MRNLPRFVAILALVCLITYCKANADGTMDPPHRVVHPPAPAVEPLPHTEQLESGQLTLPGLSDRQLTAFLIDLTNRINYDRQQHNGVAGPDAGYLQDWTARVTQEMTTRGLAADANGNVQVGLKQDVER